MSKDSKKAIQALSCLLNAFPDLRVMQALSNVLGSDDSYYVSDEELVAKIKKFIEEYSNN